jgi:hypothetical protein
MYMPTTTLYIKDSDLPLVEKAKKKLGDSLSSIFIDCLRQRVEQIPAPKGKTSRIVLEVRANQDAPTIKKSFEGRWLIHEDDDLRAEQGENDAIRWNSHTVYCLAQTKKGALVVYEYERDLNDGEATMEVYDSFEDLKADEIDNRYQRYPDNVIAAFASALGEPFEIELDI